MHMCALSVFTAVAMLLTAAVTAHLLREQGHAVLVTQLWGQADLGLNPDSAPCSGWEFLGKSLYLSFRFLGWLEDDSSGC